MTRRHTTLLALLFLTVSPASAVDRNIGITSFDSIRVDGPFRIEVVTGTSPSARISGDMRAVDAVSITSNGSSIHIRQSSINWGGMPGDDPGRATIRLSTPTLARVSVLGSGNLYINRVKGNDLRLTVGGSGSLNINHVEGVALVASLHGSGTLELAGQVEKASISLDGNGQIRGSGLSVDHLSAQLDGAGSMLLQARTTAKLRALGSGVIRIGGSAACVVENKGSGTVECGKQVMLEPSLLAASPAPSAAPAPSVPQHELRTTKDPSGVRIHRGLTPR